MDASQAYIAIAIAVLAIIAIAVFFASKNKEERKLSKLAGIAFAFVIAGIIFGEDRLVGYSLMGIGILLAVADIVLKSRKK